MPVDLAVLLAFIPASLALNLTPGADMMFSLGQGLRNGPAAALAAAAGISAGGIINSVAVGLGLGALVAAMPLALDVIRWVGVAYLLWLAWGALRHGAVAAEGPVGSASRAFRDGLIVSLSNPKVILFILAFVPQFIDPDRGAIAAQFLVFGTVLGIGGFLCNGGVGCFAAGLGQRLTRSVGFGRALSYVSAGVFGALAVRLAVMERA